MQYFDPIQFNTITKKQYCCRYKFNLKLMHELFKKY